MDVPRAYDRREVEGKKISQSEQEGERREKVKEKKTLKNLKEILYFSFLVPNDPRPIYTF